MLMVTSGPTATTHGMTPASDWVQRWSHLVPAAGAVLDIACGPGRHMKWFAERGHPVTGVDRAVAAIDSASRFGEAVLADIENAPWPLMCGAQARQFEAVLVSNYLWRPLFPVICDSIAPGGILLYETFAVGNETVGKPARADFLLQTGELLSAFKSLRFIAFEDGFLDSPPRFVQRLVAAHPDLRANADQAPKRYAIEARHSS